MKNLTISILAVFLTAGCGHGQVNPPDVWRIKATRLHAPSQDGGPATNKAPANSDQPCGSAPFVPKNALIYVAVRGPAGVEAVRIISPTEREVNTNALLAEIGKLQAILETGGVCPYVVDGQHGLLITGLEVSSGQSQYIGMALANGDVIISINGQKVPNARKAIQVLSKARFASSLDIQFSRGPDTNTLSFKRVAPELDGCFAFTYSSFGDWVALGRPTCWCEPYQCDGDADGKTSGSPFNWRIYGGDLNLILDNWKKKIDDPTLNPCADIDHKAETYENYRVYANDLSILLTAWKKKDAELAGDCPRPE